MARARFTIDEARSRVGFSVRHMVVAKVRGRFTRFGGTLALDEADPTRSQVEAHIAVASVETGDRERDHYLRTSDFLDPAQHPEMVFRSTRVLPTPGRKGESRFRVGGALTLRGITHELELQVEAVGQGQGQEDRRSFRASTRLDRRDFQLEFNQLAQVAGAAAAAAGQLVMGVVVGEQVEIELEIEVVRSGF